MLSASETRRVLELISHACLEPGLWTDALAVATAMFGSDHAILSSNTTSKDAWSFTATSGLDPCEKERFFAPETLRFLEPLHHAMPFDTTISHQRIMSDDLFHRTEFYNEVVRPTGTFYGACHQHIGSGPAFRLNVCRSRRAGEFSSDDLRGLDWLALHISLSLKIQRKVSALECRAGTLAAALDQSDEGVIAVDAAGHPLFINTKAQELLVAKDGIAITSAGLRSASGGHYDPLRLALQRAAISRLGQGERVRLPRRVQGPALMCDVVPISQIGLSSSGSPRPSIIVFLRTPVNVRPVDKAALADVYHLTAREAQIASLMMAGLTTTKVAAELRLAKGTVRNNVKRIFEKTGTHSQVELLAALRGLTLRE